MRRLHLHVMLFESVTHDMLVCVRDRRQSGIRLLKVYVTMASSGNSSGDKVGTVTNQCHHFIELVRLKEMLQVQMFKVFVAPHTIYLLMSLGVLP